MRWAMQRMQGFIPLSDDALNNGDIAMLDQFSTRLAKLQDLMGAKLFPLVLEMTKEQGSLDAFIDKLNRLEKIGAIPSAEGWLLLREMRHAFAHEYPDNAALQTSMINRAFVLAKQLLAVLTHIETFAARFALLKE